MESKWIDFFQREDLQKGVTKVYDIVSKDGDALLGKIKWYGPWRCYAFFPQANCLFEKTCLKDITGFIETLMLQRKLERQKQRTLEN
jgi:hypothetical protein